MSDKVTFNEDGMDELLNSREYRQLLDRIAFTITAHAVPHTGVDTGRLLNSMSHDIKREDGHLVAVLGSGAGDGVDPVWYASYHWAAQPDPDARKNGPEVPRRRIPHPTKKAPTRPYSKAMDELGIEYTVEPGGFLS